MEFERLTYKAIGGVMVRTGDECFFPKSFLEHTDVLDWISKAVARLSEYEELGSPEQLRNIVK